MATSSWRSWLTATAATTNSLTDIADIEQRIGYRFPEDWRELFAMGPAVFVPLESSTDYPAPIRILSVAESWRLWEQFRDRGPAGYPIIEARRVDEDEDGAEFHGLCEDGTIWAWWDDLDDGVELVDSVTDYFLGIEPDNGRD